MPEPIDTRATPPRKLPSGCLWWFRECAAIFLWAAIVTKLFVYDFDVYLIQKFSSASSWIVEYKFFAFLALLCFVGAFLGQKSLRSGLVYVLLYPFVLVLWRMPTLIFRNWALAIAFAPAIHSIATTFRTTLIWVACALLAGYTIAVTGSDCLIVGGMLVLFIFLVRHLWHVFTRALQPSRVFASLATVVEKTDRFFDARSLSSARLSEFAPESDEYRNEYRVSLATAYLINSCLRYLARKLQAVAESGKLEVYFIATLLRTLVLAVVIFAFQYWALYRLSPASFQPSDHLVFWDFLGLSINTLMTASVSRITPVGASAQVLCHLELIVTLLLISILAVIIWAVAREHYREDLARAIDKLNASEQRLVEQIERDFGGTYDELELHLVDYNLWLVNAMRKMRGQAELARPEEPEEKGLDT